MKKETKKIILILLALLLTIGISLVYCTLTEDTADANSAGRSEALSLLNLVGEDTDSENSIHLRDVDTLYESQSDDLITMYLTVQVGNSTEGTNHTWTEINNYTVYDYENMGVERYKAAALLQVGDANGVVSAGDLGYGKTVPNATVQIRGQTSGAASQKSYKIKIKDNNGSWNGQTTIALNKHQSEGLRFRNKLGFDLLSGIDQLMSLRTQFVHLYVNDLTDGSNNGFVDYGIYTQVEQLNKSALKAHGLDKNGQLYKVNEFEFYRYEDSIKLASDADYDKEAFEKLLEIKGNSDHSKLIAMLEDLNNYSIPIEDVIAEHFDEENLVYWMAFNMLIGNCDVQSRNVYLYSPKNANTWYLYSWDLDGSFHYDENIIKNNNDYLSWEEGVSNYWGNVLFQRCLKSESFRADLDAAVEDLRTYITKDRLQSMVESYQSTIEDALYQNPDVTYEPLSQEEYEEVAEKLPDLVDHYYNCYKESLEKPMPFFIGTPTIADGKMTVNWDASYDFDQEDLTYHVTLAKDPAMTEVMSSYDGNWTQMTVDAPSAGQYFLKVSVTNEDGKTQDAFDTYTVEENQKYYGTICFYVSADGNVSLEQAEE